MAWVAVSVTLGFVGLAVLAFCAFKVWLGVRGLGREVERTRRRLASEQAALRDELSDLDGPHLTRGPGEGVRST